MLVATGGAAAAGDGDPGGLAFDTEMTLSASEEGGEYIFGSISSVVEDSRGNVFVADTSQKCIMKFDAKGALVAKMTATGDGPGDLMDSLVMGCDPGDRLWIAGQGGRVEILDNDFAYVGSFSRANPENIARSMVAFADGYAAIAAVNTSNHTAIDLYDASHALEASFSDTFAAGREVSWQMESIHGGGALALADDGILYFAQRTPYLIRSLDRHGTVIGETSAGGADFVPPPPAPKVLGDRVAFRFSGFCTGVAVVSGGRVLVSAMSRGKDGEMRSLFCLYDKDLNLIGAREIAGEESIVGQATSGRVYLHRRGEMADEIVRVSVRRVEP